MMKDTRKLLVVAVLLGGIGVAFGALKAPLPDSDVMILQTKVRKLESAMEKLAGALEDSKRDHDSLKARVNHLEQMRRLERATGELIGTTKNPPRSDLGRFEGVVR